MKRLYTLFMLALCISSPFALQSQSLSGTYTIGSGGNYASISAAVNALQNNGVSGNVTFNILNGTYTGATINFASGIPNQGNNDTITFSSSSNNPGNVIISSSGTALTINNAKNLVIKKITIGSTTGTKGIELTGTCNNLEISNCIVRANTTGSSSSQAGIYYSATSTIANNIRILNNTIDGGYYGIYFYGYSYNNYCTNYTVDNNTISNTYLAGTYFYYISLNSFSNNMITSRSSNYSSTYYGSYMTYSNATQVKGNKIQALTTAIVYPYGMIFQYVNYRNTTTPVLISNNEIFVFTNSSYYGMYVTYSRANIFNNSILVGGSGTARALYVHLASGYPVSIRNNNFHAIASAAYPIYIPSASVNFLGNILTLDYNNYYNQSFVGYAGGDVTSMSNWQSITGQDIHSISIYPNYTDLFSYRLLTDGEDLICPRITSVPKDIRDTNRQAITSMGAYHNYSPKPYDTRILNLISPLKDVTVGISTPVRISLMNMGSLPVDSINIHWIVNGVSQTFLWTGTPLALGDSTPMITVGYFTPQAGENDILVYTSLLGGKIDSKPQNDTIRRTSFGCKSIINTTYTVGGSSADFLTISEAIDVISYCGVMTPTTISINPGTYNENIIVPNIRGTSSANTLTITSATGDSSSVIIQSLSSTPAITLSNTNNLIIKNLTIKGVGTGTSSTAIKMQNSNRNILITNNYITTTQNNPSSTSSTDIMAIYSHTSLDTNVTISNNYINGSGGIYFLSGGTNSNTYNVNIINNKIDNIYYFGIYSYYTRIGKINHNKIYQNPMAAIWGGGSGYGLYIYYSLGVTSTITDISNNIIRGAFGTFARFYYCVSNNGTNTNVLFSNNALIKTGAGPVTDMLYISYGQWQCINNTLVNIGTGTVTNMANISGSSTNMNISNNIFSSLTGTCTYLMYWTATGNYTLDYNDYYSVNGNIAYQGSARATLAAWQSAYPTQNIHSKNAHPNYVDSLNLVKPTNWGPLMCPKNPYVSYDILGNNRAEATYMGCYEPLFTNDAGLNSFISPTPTSTAGDTTQIIVKLINYGTNTLNTITFNYKINGVLQPQIIFTNLGLAKHKDTNLVIGFFIPIINISTNISVWCKNPNNTTDQNNLNDTISIATSGCTMVLNGHYTVGNTFADFSTINDALVALKTCGVSGPVVFELLSGTYPGFIIDTTYLGTSLSNTITFTSAAGNADSVTIQSGSTALTLSKAQYMRFTYLTFNAQSGTKGIQFTDTCNQIEIRNCIIKTNPTTTNNTHYSIYKGSNSFSLNNIKIIKNIIDGGYGSIYLLGGNSTASRGFDLIIDSNIISNTYRYGVYLQDYGHCSSISYNQITSRTNNAGSYFDAIYCYTYYDVDNITNNKIDATKSTTTTYANGIYCYYTNYYSNTSAIVQITNNEIVLRTNYDGITVYYCKASVLHNSIYITGNGNSDGVYIYVSTSYPVSLLNNNIVNLSSATSSTALYVGSTSSTSALTMDYNNYYSTQGTPCQLGSSFLTLSAWITALEQDHNSTNILPTYINTAIDLRVNGSQLICPKLSTISYDRYGIARKKLTNMGAYHTFTPLAYDITPLTIISPEEDITNYVSVPVRITVFNRGDSVINSFDIHWSVNGVNQPVYHWSGTPIALGDSTPPILLDYYTPSMGFNTFKFYTTLPNGQTDLYPANDTIQITSFACGSELSGVYTIGGSGADFPDFNTALRVLYSCGITNDVTFKINSGVYTENLSLITPVMDAGSPYRVTFTSSANHADSVIIQSSGTALTLANVRNLTFSKLTFDVISGTTGIQFTNSCSNIDINNCKIKMHPTSTSATNIGIYKANSTGILDSISIKNNLIDGGYYGMYIYGGEYISNYVYGTNIIIDSNTITNSFYCGLYLYYGDFQSISGNVIYSRSSYPSYSYYYGIQLTYANANIIGNKIKTLTPLYYAYGIYMYYYFNYLNTVNPGLIANNEIITSTTYYSYGIYSYYYNRANIINNSILNTGGTYCRGVYIANLTSGYPITIKNNNIIISNSGYPIYLAANTSDLILDYNNYYAPTYIGYYSGNYTLLSSWKTAVGKDNNSVSVNPSFININVSMELASGVGLSCPRNADVLKDIKGLLRKTTTSMGAYEAKYDLSVSKVTEPINGANLCSQNTTDVDIVLTNIKPTGINFSTDSVTIHVKISGAMTFQKDTTLKTGTINGLQSDTFLVVNDFLLIDTGTYYILSYIDKVDENTSNDTIRTSFHVNQSYFHTDTITICNNELPLTYGDSTFAIGTTSGNYPIYFTLPTGCDSLITLTLNVNPSYHHYDTLSICDNELPMNYGDSLFPVGSLSGNYLIHFTLPTGCDSLIALRLNIHPTYKHYDTVTLCSNDLPYSYGDSIFGLTTSNGIYPVHFTLPTGCDSLIQLTLYINPSYSHKDTITLCDNEFPLSYGDSVFPIGTFSGNYPIHYTLATGCDSLIALTLIVNPTYQHYDSLFICDNELPLVYGDSVFGLGTTSGTYPVHFTLPTGCDSLINLILVVFPTYIHYDTVSICESDLPFVYGDSTFKVGTTTGTYPIHFTLLTGCDSLINLRLIIHPSYSHTDTISLCNNELPLYYGDSIFPIGTISGNYSIHFTLPTGCDSLITLTIIVNPSYNHNNSLTICDNELPLTYGDSIFPIGTTDGVYPVHYTLSTGCDSLVMLHLFVNPSYTFYDTIRLCDIDLPLSYADTTFLYGAQSGDYTFTYVLATGCDSIRHLHLKINPTYIHTDTVSICNNDLPLMYGDSLFPIGTVSGTYPIHFTLPTTCDSLLMLTLIVNQAYSIYDTLTVCNSEIPYSYGDSTLYTAGNYIINFTSTKGCDSTIYLRFNVFNCNSTDIVDICSTDLPYAYGDSIFTSGGIYQVVFKAYTGLDSIVALTLRVHSIYNHYDTISVCNNEFPFVYGDSSILIPGNHIVQFTSIWGCDSNIYLTVYNTPSYEFFDTISICDNELPYTYADSLLPNSGNYNFIFNSIQNCDSIIHLYLNVYPTYMYTDTLSICSNELPYSYGDSIFTVGIINGIYPIHFTSVYGCDSLIMLTLYINNSYAHFDTLTLCSSELPLIYGDSIFNVGTVSGDYPITFTLSTGCDSIITLHLNIYSGYTHTDTISICENEFPLIYGDSIFNVGTSSGDYQIIYTLPTGCDSIIHLNLNVHSTYNHFDSLTIFDIDLPYTYGDSTFPIGTIDGDYIIPFTSIYGCDSIISLHLVIIPTYHFMDTVSICDNELPYTYADQILDSAGNYIINLKTTQGSDSIIVLTLYVYPNYNETVLIHICDYELPYIFGNDTFDFGGNYLIEKLTTNGCDSNITLYLVVNTIPLSPDTIFGNHEINTIGRYTYYIKPIDNADYYIWNISNPEWIGNSTSNVISVFIPTPNQGILTVKAANECGESEATEITISSSIGIIDITENTSINIYPNPANDYFYLKTNGLQGKTSILISDISGKILYIEEINITKTNDIFKFYTSEYVKGFYLISIINNSQTINKKLIVE